MKYQFYAIIFDVAGNQVSSKSASSPLTITTATQLVTSVSLSPNSAQTKNIGETFTITPTVGPSNANNKNVNWISSNTNVATVSKASTASGTAITVTCKAAGTANITATAADGSGKSASLSLTVHDPLTSLTLDKSQITLLYGGATTTVTATTTPSGYDANNLSWTIGNTSLATISGTGKTRTITSNNTKKTGETILTVSGGGKTATMKVSIVNFQTTTYNYTGSIQQVDLPAGTYKLEVWGAQGGSTSYSTGGKGGYSIGTISIASNAVIYVCIGGCGSTNKTSSGTANGGYNGGGNGYSDGPSGSNYNGGSGGGATHIALNSGTLQTITSSNVLIVAGGGGGAFSGYSSHYAGGGYGGGLSGGGGNLSGSSISGIAYGRGGSSSNSGSNGVGSNDLTSGGYGFGGGHSSGGCGASCGGGGGWYGGGASSYINSSYLAGGAGGGSGYVNTSKLTSAQTIAGNQSFPNVAGTGNETGHSGNGAAKITPVS